MDSLESFQRFGTISLGDDFMRKNIFIGDCFQDEEGRLYFNKGTQNFNLQIWLSFIPPAFQHEITRLSYKIASEHVMNQNCLDQSLVNKFVDVFQDEMLQAYENGSLTKEGWKHV